MAPGGLRAGRRHRVRDEDRDVGLLVGGHLQARVAQLVPLGLLRHDLAAQQAHDRLERLAHPPPLRRRLDAELVGVGVERAGADAEVDAASRQVVELDHAMGEREGVVVGQADHARAEADVPRALGRRRDEQRRVADGFPAGAVMLADPGLVEVEAVEELDHLHVALVGDGRMLAGLVEGLGEDPELQGLAAIGHRPALAFLARAIAARPASPSRRGSLRPSRGAREAYCKPARQRIASLEWLPKSRRVRHNSSYRRARRHAMHHRQPNQRCH